MLPKRATNQKVGSSNPPGRTIPFPKKTNFFLVLPVRSGRNSLHNHCTLALGTLPTAKFSHNELARFAEEPDETNCEAKIRLQRPGQRRSATHTGWACPLANRLKLGDTVAEREGINAALESVWQAKREYRVGLAKKRALRFSTYRKAHKQISAILAICCSARGAGNED